LCAYGAEHLQQALQMYAVAEMLLAENSTHGGLDMSAWAELAANHKVAVVNVIKRDSVMGKRFCDGVGVGAVLWRKMEISLDSPTSSDEYASSSSYESDDAFGLAIDEDQLLPPPVAEVQIPRHHINESSSLQGAHAEFFAWLRRALHEEVDAATASALLDGVYVVLKDDFSGECEMQEALASAEEILSEAPDCARDLRSIWCATHIDQDLALDQCWQEQTVATKEQVLGSEQLDDKLVASREDLLDHRFELCRKFESLGMSVTNIAEDCYGNILSWRLARRYPDNAFSL
jgi:hypothetical protein